MTAFPEVGVDQDAVTVDHAEGYRSPLMARLSSGSGQLTLELLRAEVPAFQAGREAQEALAAGNLSAAEQTRLRSLVQQGERAKERLVMAAIPLIKHLAQKEHRRRQNWQSQVTFEDLFQEGTAGFLRGLAKYNPEGDHKSATNYLGQWILVTMQREVEHIDNDFGVAYDASERFRRIRALRARLWNELGREPTDDELIEASTDSMFSGSGMRGRAKKAPGTGTKALTPNQLEEERELRFRIGQGQRLERALGPDGSGTIADYAQSLDTVEQPLSAEAVVEDGAREGLAKVLQATLDAMSLPNAQREVICRRFGLPPHLIEESARDISRAMDLARDKVGKVIEAFQSEMARPGGAFHRICTELSADELADLGLGYVTTMLGEYERVSPVQRNQPLPEALTVPVAPRSKMVPPPAIVPSNRGRDSEVKAQFMCAYHVAGFVGTYPDTGRVPKHRACPQCGQPSRLVRIMPSTPA